MVWTASKAEVCCIIQGPVGKSVGCGLGVAVSVRGSFSKPESRAQQPPKQQDGLLGLVKTFMDPYVGSHKT